MHFHGGGGGADAVSSLLRRGLSADVADRKCGLFFLLSSLRLQTVISRRQLDAPETHPGTVGNPSLSAFQRFQDDRKRCQPPKVMNAYYCMLFLCFSNVFDRCTKMDPRGGGGGPG